jgi:hypothetical protein
MIFEMVVMILIFLLHLQLFFGISFSNTSVSAKKKVRIKQGKFIRKKHQKHNEKTCKNIRKIRKTESYEAHPTIFVFVF